MSGTEEETADNWWKDDSVPKLSPVRVRSNTRRTGAAAGRDKVMGLHKEVRYPSGAFLERLHNQVDQGQLQIVTRSQKSTDKRPPIWSICSAMTRRGARAGIESHEYAQRSNLQPRRSTLTLLVAKQGPGLKVMHMHQE